MAAVAGDASRTSELRKPWPCGHDALGCLSLFLSSCDFLDWGYFLIPCLSFSPISLQYTSPDPNQPASQRLRFDINPNNHPFPSSTPSPLSFTYTHHTAAPAYSSPPAPRAPHQASLNTFTLQAPVIVNPGSHPPAYPYLHARPSVAHVLVAARQPLPFAGTVASQHQEQQQHPHPHLKQLQPHPLLKHVWQYKSVPVGGLSGDGQQSDPQHPMQRQRGEAGSLHAQTQNRPPHEQQQDGNPPASQRTSTPLPWHAQYAPQQQHHQQQQQQ